MFERSCVVFLLSLSEIRDALRESVIVRVFDSRVELTTSSLIVRLGFLEVISGFLFVLLCCNKSVVRLLVTSLGRSDLSFLRTYGIANCLVRFCLCGIRGLRCIRVR